MNNPNQDHNLLSFLKNQSVFNQSPNRRLSRSRGKSEKNRLSPSYNQQLNYNPNTSAPQNYPQNYQQDNYRNSTGYQANNYQSNIVQGQTANYQNNYQTQGTVGGNYQTTSNNYQVQTGTNLSGGLSGAPYTNNYTFENNAEDVNRTVMGAAANLVTYSTSFESARFDTAQRLEGLAQKVKAQLSNLNYKIEMFNSQMMSVVSQEYNHIKERIYAVIEETFRDSEGYIKEYMRAQEVKFAEEIFRAREALQREIANIEAMREDISKPYWRAMAGVFVTTEFEASIESVIKQCQTIQTKNIEFETTGYKLKDMEKYLVDSVKQRLERIHQFNINNNNTNYNNNNYNNRPM